MPAVTDFFVATCYFHEHSKTVWPSGLRRWLKAPFRKGVGSNPTAVNVHGFMGQRFEALKASTDHIVERGSNQ